MDVLRDEVLKRINETFSNRTNLLVLVLAVLIIFFGGYAVTGYLSAGPGTTGPGGNSDPGNTPDAPLAEITTFSDSGLPVCTEDGKPIVRLFSTTSCPHCTWIAGTYDRVVQEYVDAGEIVAYHWELDSRDDTLTDEREGLVPEVELATYRQFSPGGGVPAFVFGCKYYRLGNGHERGGDLAAEEAEFRAVIDEIMARAG